MVTVAARAGSRTQNQAQEHQQQKQSIVFHDTSFQVFALPDTWVFLDLLTSPGAIITRPLAGVKGPNWPDQ